jgi:hypothetical protein
MSDVHEVSVAQGSVPAPLIVQVLDRDGDPTSLEDATRVRFRLKSREQGTVVDGRGRVADAELGHVAYDWDRRDLEIPTRPYDAAFHVRFDDGTSIVAPTVGRLVVSVRDSPFGDSRVLQSSFYVVSRGLESARRRVCSGYTVYSSRLPYST